MKYRRPIFPLLVMLALGVPAIGQTPSDNLDKYWDYRTRFFDKFILDIDPNSLPTGAPPNGINLPSGLYTSSMVKWGDTGIKTGRYITAMATEYKLLQLESLDNSNPQEKIYRALNAINRLDSYAEPFYGCGVSGDPPCYDYTNINGFFIRDDVDETFFDYWATHGKSDWENRDSESDHEHEDGILMNEMSQDQVIHLMMGHSVVKEFVDATITYEDFPCDYVFLTEMAKRQTYRSIKYMQTWNDDNNWTWKPYGNNNYPGKWVPIFNPLFPPIPNWRIKNPCSGQNVSRGGTFFDLYPHKDLFEDAGDWITGESPASLNYWSPNPLLPPFELEINPDLPFGSFFNDAMKLTLATIADVEYSSSLDELFWNIRKCADHYNDNISGNPYDIQYFWLDDLPMLSVLLHDKDPLSSDLFLYYYSHIEQLLNEAPVDGPVCYVFPPTEYIWTRASMFDSPMGVYISNPDNQRLGEYNGLDYMVLFNLYHLVYKAAFNDPISVINDFPTTYTYSSYNFEYGNETINIGHEDNEALYTIHSKTDITMNSTVNPNGKIRLMGNTVILQPGFEVKLGGEFIATINESMDLDFTPPVGNYKSAVTNQSSSFESRVEETSRIETEKDGSKNQSRDPIKIYPNPAKNAFFIESPSVISNITIYNSGGTIITQTCGEGYEYMYFNISNYVPGLYFISITSEEGDVGIQKLIIE
jgi:hypothetical protein